MLGGNTGSAQVIGCCQTSDPASNNKNISSGACSELRVACRIAAATLVPHAFR